ncbi:MAG TPA: nucleotide sugar dehydrogenase [Pseudolabrys sp.]|jgi:UDP-N-acetyl-D-mannosaminuronic acid dehydrogenase|nr:nucleotide sugar dehydrogenase [Pseudolabrys sp.]
MMTIRPDIAAPEAPTTVENADITVVGGAGHVGIPLVLALAEAGLRVNVNDLNQATLDTLKSGKLPFIEYGAESVLIKALAGNRLVFTNSSDKISRGGPVIVTIGTPIDEFLNPVRRVVQDCIDALLPQLADGQLLVLRSTVFPGTTDWLASYLEAKKRKLKVAFCPERVVQGYGLKELREMPQLVSGTTPEAERDAVALFERITPEVVVMTPIEAEFAKLFANAYRYIEFAVTNEFYLITKSAGVDYQRVLAGMKHNYPRLKNIPRPGFAAGPCLMKDTMQLSAYARNRFGLGHAALLINEGLVLHVIDDLKNRFDLSKTTVGLLGMAFKAESDDVRASLSYKFKKMLGGQVRAVLTTDPFVTTDPELLPLTEVIERSDLLILCAPHTAYRTADFKGKPVVDIWGELQGANLIR